MHNWLLKAFGMKKDCSHSSPHVSAAAVKRFFDHGRRTTEVSENREEGPVDFSVPALKPQLGMWEPPLTRWVAVSQPQDLSRLMICPQTTTKIMLNPKGEDFLLLKSLEPPKYLCPFS